MVAVAGDAGAGDDCAQVQPSAEVLACVVEPAPETHVAVIRVHKDFGAVEHVAVGIVSRDETFAGNLFVGVAVAELLVIHDQGQRRGDNTAVVFDANLPFREAPQLCLETILAEGAAQWAGVDVVHHCLEVVIILYAQVAQLESVFLGGSRRFGHGARRSGSRVSFQSSGWLR